MKIEDILDEVWYQTGKCYSEEYLMEECPEWLKAQLGKDYPEWHKAKLEERLEWLEEELEWLEESK